MISSLFGKKKDNPNTMTDRGSMIPAPPRQPYGNNANLNSPRQQQLFNGGPNPNMNFGQQPPMNPNLRYGPPRMINPNMRPNIPYSNGNPNMNSNNISNVPDASFVPSNNRDDLERQVKDLFNQLTIARMESKEDKRLNRKLSIKNSELLAQLDEAKRAIVDMQSVLKTVQTATNDITRQRDLREKDFQRIIKENRDLQKVIAEHRESVARTFELENKLKDNDLALRTLAHNKDDIIRRMNEQISLNHEIAMKSQGETIRARGEKQVLEAEIENLHEQIAVMQDTSYRVQTENLKLKGEKVMVESELETWKNKINTLELRLKRQVQKDFHKEVQKTMKDDDNNNDSIQILSGVMDQTRNLIKKDFNLLENKIEGLEKIMQNALYERLSAVENQIKSSQNSPNSPGGYYVPYQPSYQTYYNQTDENNIDKHNDTHTSITTTTDENERTNSISHVDDNTEDTANDDTERGKFKIGLKNIISSMRSSALIRSRKNSRPNMFKTKLANDIIETNNNNDN